MLIRSTKKPKKSESKTAGAKRKSIEPAIITERCAFTFLFPILQVACFLLVTQR